MSPPRGRPEEGSLPLGGKARSAKGARHRPSPGRPKEGDVPLGGTARSAKGAPMSATRTFAAGYLESLLAGQPRLPASPLAWLNKLRAEAVDRVGVLTVPTIRDEEWRFTDLSPLTKRSFSQRACPSV